MYNYSYQGNSTSISTAISSLWCISKKLPASSKNILTNLNYTTLFHK